MATLAIAPAFPFYDWGIILGQDMNLLLIYGVGNYFFMKSMKYLEAGEVMIFANTEPVIGLVLAAIVLNERLMPLQIAGFLFILVASFLIAKSDKSYVSLEG
nr:EamA family transporter [endosymbiont 'TC1' of Trimyema compressum]